MKEQKSLPSPHQSPQVPTTMHDQRHERILRMLKHSVLAKLASTTNSPVSGPTTITQLEQMMQKVFPQSFHTPTHPTYASMILRAIDELKEEKGSSEVAISAFIKREYNDLPWGHESFLSHHLRKLCRNGDIKCTRGGLYMLEDENQEDLQQTAVCEKLLEDRWKLKQGPHGESKSDTSMIEGQLCQRREDSADEKQRQQEQKIDARSTTIEFRHDDVEGLNVPPVMIEEKLQRRKWQNVAFRKDRQQDQKMEVKPEILPSFQDDEENGLSLNLLEKALTSSPQRQQENLEQSQLRQLYCEYDGSVMPALNQLQQIHNCERNESNLSQNDLSAWSELHVDAEKEKYSSSKILPRQETELNLNAIASCSSNAKQHLEQQPPKCGRGRPGKIICDVKTTSVASSQSYSCKFNNYEERQLAEWRERGRPRKQIADAEETTSEKPTVVPSQSYHYKFYNLEETQLPQRREHKLVSDAVKTIVIPSQSYHYKFYNHEETQIP